MQTHRGYILLPGAQETSFTISIVLVLILKLTNRFPLSQIETKYLTSLQFPVSKRVKALSPKGTIIHKQILL